jgi:hypothetical protein
MKETRPSLDMPDAIDTKRRKQKKERVTITDSHILIMFEKSWLVKI